MEVRPHLEHVQITEHFDGNVLAADENAKLEADNSGATLFINFVEKDHDISRKFYRSMRHPFHHHSGRWNPPEHARNFAGAFPAFGITGRSRRHMFL